MAHCKEARRIMRIIVADDHPVIRRGLMELIGNEPGVSIIGEACDGIEAVELARLLHPDLILMDINMPEMNGVKATQIIKSELPEIQVVAISMYEDQHIIHKMMEAGATTYIVKGESFDKLLAVIRSDGEEHGRKTE